MAVFVVNAGSSSVKFRLYAEDGRVAGACLAEGLVERIGAVDARFNYKSYAHPDHLDAVSDTPTVDMSETQDIPDHEAALNAALRAILNRETGVLRTRADVRVVGHRMVHGGDKLVRPTLINREVKDEIQRCVRFAPLHNPVNLAGLAACERLFPAAHHVAVFDTAFHATLPDHAYLYPLPYILYERHRIRRYGFHGTSHKYVSRRARALLSAAGRGSGKIIVLHLGNGSSACAVHEGLSVDTSMGFTPLEGLMMGTRTGDLDPGVLIALLNLEGMSVEELDRIINKYSGFKGITEDTSDVRTVLEKAANGYDRHRVALDIFCHRARKYIGSYAAVLDGVDALVFTGGIGENAVPVRARICEGLSFLGVEIDAGRNASRSRAERFISSDASRTAVAVIPTNEEWMIAQESLEVVSESVGRTQGLTIADGALTAEERLLLVRTWNEVGGDPVEAISTFQNRTGHELSPERLSAELATVGIRL